MAKPEPLYRWTWNDRGPYRKPYYVIACRWCYGTFEAARSDAVTGSATCRKALSRYNRALVDGLDYEQRRYRDTVKRFSRRGKTCLGARKPLES